GTASADADDGSFSVPLDPALTNGEDVSATATDAAGNRSDPTGATAPDLTAPDAPSATVAEDGTAVTGTAEPGSTITVNDADGNEIGSATAGDDGSFSVPLDPALTNGEDVTATATDPAGNQSDPTGATAPDLTAPDAPSATVAEDGTAVTGTAEPGSTVTINDADGNELGTASADADDGSFSVPLDPALTNGEDVSATATDAAGNQSDPTGATAPDLTAPDAPVINPTNGEEITGTAEPGSTVTLTDGDDNAIGAPAPVGEDGTWSVTPDTPLEDETQVEAVATDAAGNTSDPSSTIVDIDLGDVTPPQAPEVELANDTGVDDADGITSDGTVNVTGLEEGATWQYSIDSGTTWTDGTGDSFTLEPGNYGDGVVQVRQTDSASNTGPSSTPGPVTIDQNAPVITLDALDAPINDDSPALSGTVDDPDATVTVTVNGSDYTAANNGDGTWTLAEGTVTLNEGDNSVSAVATDAAGNTSEPVTDTVELDTTAPGEGDDALNSVIFSDDVYNAAEADSATLSGTVEDGATIDSLTITSAGGGDPLTIAGEDITLNGDGTFSYTADLTGLPDGDLTATLSITDAAGNTGTVTDTATLDQMPPVLTLDSVDDPINDDSPALTGSVDDPEATVTVTVDGTDYA
ncbi:Ig-like domain-containing protein, partial [Chromohalobacter sp. 48-RD10]|uniref:Ig-like domain-containing protein n=1 Tax=Chromohalobacter sp. 48-RD10 TaxID=2994063 RepID=UPI0024683B38